MREEIIGKEVEHFEFIYDHLRDNFPKICSCGRRYGNELDYNERTDEVDGLSNFLCMDILQFYRNCPNCGTTYGLTLSDGEEARREWRDFVGYTFYRAKEENKSFEDASMDVRKEYNEIFLPRKWAEEQMLKNPELYENLDYHLNVPFRKIPL